MMLYAVGLGYPTVITRRLELDGVKVLEKQNPQREYMQYRWWGFILPSNEEVLSIGVPARGRAQDNAFRGQFTPGGDYLVLAASYNGRRPPKLFVTDEPDHEPLGAGGVKLVWQYGDGHGMEYAAVMRLTQPEALVKISVTGHHDHSWQRFVVKVGGGKITVIERDGPWTPPERI